MVEIVSHLCISLIKPKTVSHPRPPPYFKSQHSRPTEGQPLRVAYNFKGVSQVALAPGTYCISRDTN